jgi:nucleotide-binding universal stress UspA family protein
MHIRKILVAHDFSEPASRALATAAQLAMQVQAELEVVHVHPDVYNGHGDAALGTPWPTPDQEQRYLRFLEQELERVVVEALGERAAAVKRHIVRGDPVRQLEQLADAIDADVVCVGSTGKGAVQRVLLGSVSQRIVRTSKRRVLTVH